VKAETPRLVTVQASDLELGLATEPLSFIVRRSLRSLRQRRATDFSASPN
jgi:hypothetical protein